MKSKILNSHLITFTPSLIGLAASIAIFIFASPLFMVAAPFLVIGGLVISAILYRYVTRPTQNKNKSPSITETNSDKLADNKSPDISSDNNHPTIDKNNSNARPPKATSQSSAATKQTPSDTYNHQVNPTQNNSSNAREKATSPTTPQNNRQAFSENKPQSNSEAGLNNSIHSQKNQVNQINSQITLNDPKIVQIPDDKSPITAQNNRQAFSENKPQSNIKVGLNNSTHSQQNQGNISPITTMTSENFKISNKIQNLIDSPENNGKDLSQVIIKFLETPYTDKRSLTNSDIISVIKSLNVLEQDQNELLQKQSDFISHNNKTLFEQKLKEAVTKTSFYENGKLSYDDFVEYLLSNYIIIGDLENFMQNLKKETRNIIVEYVFDGILDSINQINHILKELQQQIKDKNSISSKELFEIFKKIMESKYNGKRILIKEDIEKIIKVLKNEAFDNGKFETNAFSELEEKKSSLVYTNNNSIHSNPTPSPSAPIKAANSSVEEVSETDIRATLRKQLTADTNVFSKPLDISLP